MMTLLPRNAPTNHTKARVGTLGGFFTVALYDLAGDDERAYLHENKLGGAGDAPEECVEDGKYLLGYFYGRKDHERQLSEKERWLRKIQKVDMGERKQGRNWFRACNRLLVKRDKHEGSQRHTTVSDKNGLKLQLCKAFRVVHHARAPTNISEDKNRH